MRFGLSMVRGAGWRLSGLPACGAGSGRPASVRSRSPHGAVTRSFGPSCRPDVADRELPRSGGSVRLAKAQQSEQPLQMVTYMSVAWLLAGMQTALDCIGHAAHNGLTRKLVANLKMAMQMSPVM